MKAASPPTGPALPVWVAAALETFVADHAEDLPVDAALAGFCLFTLYGRLRAGDASIISTLPSLELSGGVGFVEASTLEHKTAGPVPRVALPVAAPNVGVSGRDWTPR